MATIIRRDGERTGSPSEAKHPLTFSLSNMSERGDEYVRQVQTEAAKEVRSANDEANAIRQRAEAEGLAKASAESDKRLEAMAADRLKTLTPAVESAVRQIVDARGEWLAHWESAAVHLAARIAEKVIRRELKEDPQIGQQWVREALELTAGASEVTVRLNPGDHQHGVAYVEKLVDSLQGLGEARVVADQSVEPGGCVVDTKYGRIENGLSAQLERLTTELV